MARLLTAPYATSLPNLDDAVSDSLSRREWLKLIGAAGAGSVLVPGSGAAGPRGSVATGRPRVLPLSSTSEVFVPPRGRAFMKFSFDFPEPSVPSKVTNMSAVS